MDGKVNDFSESCPVNFAVFNHFGQINGAQVAGFIGKKRLLSAGIS